MVVDGGILFFVRGGVGMSFYATLLVALISHAILLHSTSR